MNYSRSLKTHLARPALICSLLLSMLLPLSARSADLSTQGEALNVIADFADRICEKIPLEGSGDSLRLSGEAQIELNKLLKHLAEISGKAELEYETSKFKGLLQKDLAGVLNTSINCKLDVFQELKESLLDSDENGATGKPPPEYFPPAKVALRSEPAVLSDDDVRKMLLEHGFYATYLNPKAKGFPNEFEVRQIRNQDVVVDYATRLMWKREGSESNYTWYKAGSYIRDLNVMGYAGYSDWRLPTIEEIASLMKPTKSRGGSHIDPLFDLAEVLGCWTSDRKVYDTAQDTAWLAGFSYGGFVHGGHANNHACVLAVRSAG